MRFHDPERFEKYCVAKRRTYLRQLAGRPNPGRFFDLWRGEFDLTIKPFQIGGLRENDLADCARGLRWLLLSDLYTQARRFVPDLMPAPTTVIENLTGGLHQVRRAGSMLITGEKGAGKEQLAILLHVLAGRPGALVRIPARELGGEGRPGAGQLMPERGSVFIQDLEEIQPAAQEELLTFLRGEARRRDLLFFAATQVRPWDLAGLGVRRELVTRVSQTEIRLPRISTRSADIEALVADVVFDQTRIRSGRMGALREEAERLAAEWRSDRGIPAPQDYDFFSEALSYVLWRAKTHVAAATLAQMDPTPIPETGSFRAIADAVSRSMQTERPDGDSDDQDSAEPTPAVRTREKSPRARVPTHLDRDGLLRGYYLALLEEEGSNLRRVAERTGLKLPALTAEFARLGVLPEESRERAPRKNRQTPPGISSHLAKQLP